MSNKTITGSGWKNFNGASTKPKNNEKEEEFQDDVVEDIGTTAGGMPSTTTIRRIVVKNDNYIDNNEDSRQTNQHFQRDAINETEKNYNDYDDNNQRRPFRSNDDNTNRQIVSNNYRGRGGFRGYGGGNFRGRGGSFRGGRGGFNNRNNNYDNNRDDTTGGDNNNARFRPQYIDKTVGTKRTNDEVDERRDDRDNNINNKQRDDDENDRQKRFRVNEHGQSVVGGRQNNYHDRRDEKNRVDQMGYVQRRNAYVAYDGDKVLEFRIFVLNNQNTNTVTNQRSIMLMVLKACKFIENRQQHLIPQRPGSILTATNQGREILDRFVFNAQTNFKFTIISSNGNPNSYKEEMAKADLTIFDLTADAFEHPLITNREPFMVDKAIMDDVQSRGSMQEFFSKNQHENDDNSGSASSDDESGDYSSQSSSFEDDKRRDHRDVSTTATTTATTADNHDRQTEQSRYQIRRSLSPVPIRKYVPNYNNTQYSNDDDETKQYRQESTSSKRNRRDRSYDSEDDDSRGEISRSVSNSTTQKISTISSTTADVAAFSAIAATQNSLSNSTKQKKLIDDDADLCVDYGDGEQSEQNKSVIVSSSNKNNNDNVEERHQQSSKTTAPKQKSYKDFMEELKKKEKKTERREEKRIVEKDIRFNSQNNRIYTVDDLDAFQPNFKISATKDDLSPEKIFLNSDDHRKRIERYIDPTSLAMMVAHTTKEKNNRTVAFINTQYGDVSHIPDQFCRFNNSKKFLFPVVGYSLMMPDQYVSMNAKNQQDNDDNNEKSRSLALEEYAVASSKMTHKTSIDFSYVLRQIISRRIMWETMDSFYNTFGLKESDILNALRASHSKDKTITIKVVNPEGRFDNLSRFYQEDVASCEDKFTKMFGEKIIEDCIVEEQFTIFTITTRWAKLIRDRF